MSCQSGCISDFSLVVGELYQQIGSPSGAGGYSEAQISGYFLSPANLAKLNISVDTCYCLSGLYSTGMSPQITGFAFSPPLCGRIIGVYTNQFLTDYYNTFANQVLRSSMSNQGGIQQLKEADNSITFLNKNQIAATIRGLAKDAQVVWRDSIVDFLRFEVGAGALVLSEDAGNWQPYPYFGLGYFGGLGYGGWGYWGNIPYYGGRAGYGY